MKNRVLARVHIHEGGWIASAYRAEDVFCSVSAPSEMVAMAELGVAVEGLIAVEGRPWLEQWKHGGDVRVPNCPEGAVKLPIDLWTCKLEKKTCPIQAQIFLDDPDRFFRHCLAPRDRMQEIFDTVAAGKYDGFHHIPGRYLCVACQHDGRAAAFQYHYPWELTSVEAYCQFELMRDWPRLRRQLLSKGWSMSEVSNALCAAHCRELAEKLDPAVAAELRVLEFELSR
jgi:hypothetical protein